MIPGTVSLAGRWKLEDEHGEYRTELDLPGDVISGLCAAGLIPEPYSGCNEYGLRWIAERDWTLSRDIELNGHDFDLVLSGVDTVATIRVNGHVVLEARNAHRTWRAALSKVAFAGRNRIEITVHSAPRAANSAQQEQPFFVPDHGDNSPIRNGNMLRKPQCDFGWDWNIALAPLGVYGDMRLEPRIPLRIDTLHVSQNHLESDVWVTVNARLNGRTEGPAQISFTLGGQKQSLPVPAGETCPEVTVRFVVADPDLWWPAGQGDQPLHELVVLLGEQTEIRRIGLRRIELMTEHDEVGTGFAFHVNGRPVFARGANWIPADALAGRIGRASVRELLQSAVDANMNMIRVWGGGRYEPDWFYDLCDELGLMVWQDFMFACNLYPSTPEFLAEVASEVRENVLRIHHHACLALWCGDNELVGALTWFEESRRNRDRYLVSYDRLNRTIEATLKQADPDANWWPSSPSRGSLDFGDGWHDDSAGDMHFWSVWHEGRDFDHYRDVRPRFCSEFGFQSFPSMNVIRNFADAGDLNISSPVLECHQKNRGGNARIAETMFRYFRFPSEFEDFVYLSQVQQGLAINTAVSHWRSLKPHCMGALFWQLNDTWPVSSWSSIDYGGGWKLLHHMARRFFAPVLLTVVPAEGGYLLRAVNDGPADTQVSWQLIGLSLSGSERPLAAGNTILRTSSAASLADIARPDVGKLEVLLFRWQLPDGTCACDHFAPKSYKSWSLPDPHLLMKVRKEKGGAKIFLSASAPAFYTAIEASCPGRFSDNAVLVLPGYPVEITFNPKSAGEEPEFTLRDLYSATSQTVRMP